MDWYLVHTRRGCEQVTACHITHILDLEVYLAEVLQRWHGAARRAPLFPGYLFVAAPGEQAAVEFIDRTAGCGRLVCACSDQCTVHPVILTADTIEQLRQQLIAADAAGGMPLNLLSESEYAVAKVHQHVASAANLTAAIIGLHTPTARIALLLHAVGVDEAQARMCEDNQPSAPVVKRLRRTRGHGRIIHYSQI